MAVHALQIQPPVLRVYTVYRFFVPAEQPVNELNHDFFFPSSRAHSRRSSFTSLRFCVRRVFMRPPRMHIEQRRAGTRSLVLVVRVSASVLVLGDKLPTNWNVLFS